jgi:hypothetical protein
MLSGGPANALSSPENEPSPRLRMLTAHLDAIADEYFRKATSRKVKDDGLPGCMSILIASVEAGIRSLPLSERSLIKNTGLQALPAGPISPAPGRSESGAADTSLAQPQRNAPFNLSPT